MNPRHRHLRRVVAPLAGRPAPGPAAQVTSVLVLRLSRADAGVEAAKVRITRLDDTGGAAPASISACLVTEDDLVRYVRDWFSSAALPAGGAEP